MHLIKEKMFDEVKAFELGWSPAGKPLMTVHLYLLGEICIDTGQSHMAREVIQITKANRTGIVLLTHHHEDHTGNAAAIVKGLNIPVLGHPVTAEKMKTGFKILPYQHIIWGKSEPVSIAFLPKTIETKKFQLEPIHAPGHSKDHTVFWERNHGWLFSGDIYLSDRVKYFRADERIKDQITSLRKILSYDFEALFCGHHPQPQQGKSKLSQKLNFLEDFYGKVKFLHEKGLYDGKVIFRQMGLKEEKFIKWFCMGNVSMLNMVRSAMASFRNEHENV
jgi:glyoxylase-like metal-dependent hydrolase (beta-lactamase superfamily II)